MYEKIIFILIICFYFVSCNSTRYISDNSERDREYRETMSEIRTGETELVITSKDIEQSVNGIIGTSKNIEKSIRESTNFESDIRAILQRVRDRKITDNDEYSETEWQFKK